MSDIPESTIIHSQDPDKRRDILLRLKDAARKLTPFAHQQGSSVPITNAINAVNHAGYVQRLDEHVSEAYELCTLIEICLMNGIRIREFQGVIPLWGLLERLVSVQSLMGKPVTPKKNASQNTASNTAKSHKNGTNSLHATVETVARLTFLRTPVAKSRGWIRHALNTRTLDDCLNTLLQEAKILSLFYSPDAILSHPDNVTIFMAVIRTLKVLPFEYSLDDVSLNSTPSWAVAMVAAGGYRPLQSPPSEFPMMTGRSSSFYSHNRAPQKQRGIFSSIFGSIERSINGVFDTVDNFANRSLDIEVKDNRERRELKEMMERERDNLPPLIPLFGTSLRDLVLDSRRCGVSHMAPQLGVPSMVISMISFLSSNVDTPGLFRQKINLESSEELRLFLESERGIPGLGSMSEIENEQMVHIVAFTLLQWLTELSEPLLGSTHYYALEACQEVEEEKPRIRNFSLLLQEAPWYSQPLLSKILSFLCLCLDEEHSAKNGLSLVAISVLFTPFLFRKDSYLHNVREHSRIGSSFFSSLSDVRMVERDEEARHYLSIAAAGSCTIEFLIMKESEVLLPLRSSLTQIRTTLAAKIVRVRGLMDEVGIGVSVSSLSFYWLELMHKEGEDPLNSNTEMVNTEIESTNTPSNSSKSDKLNESNKSNHSNSLKYCEKVNLNDYVKNTKKIGNDERPDGKKEGEEKLYELSFDLHFALKTMHNARKLSLLTGDDNLKENNSDDNTFNNSSDCHPSNHIRILIEKQYIKERNEEIERKFHEITDEKINGDKILTENKSVLSSHSAFGGISVKNQEKVEEENAEMLLFPTVEELNLSNRWGVCGFQPGNPLKDFQSNGLLALRSLTEFLLRYENAASQLGEVFVLQRSKYCTYAQVAVQLSKFAADTLRLTPTPYTPLGAPLQYLAKQPSWLLLSEQNCYQEVFNLSMLTFDEAWRASTEERGTFPHVDTYEQCLLYVRETLDVIIAAAPRSLEGMWTHWIRLMDLRRTEASALFSPSSTSTSTTPSRKNSPRLHAPITATHAYVIAGDKYGEKYDKKDRNDVEIIGVKDNKVLNVLSGSTGSEVEVEGEEGKVLKKSTVATVSPALSSAYSATSVDSDDDIISGEYRGVERGGGREGGVGGGGKGRGGQKDDEYDGIKVHGPTLLGSARSAQLHAMYTSSESKGKGDEKGKVRGEKKEEGKGERKEGKGEGKGDEKGEWMEEMEKGEGKEEMKAEAKEQGHTHDSHETDVVWLKSVNGIETKVIGGSHIFNNTHITQLEAVLPDTHQCDDWRLLYRLSRDGASLNTLLLNSTNHQSYLLVIKDLNGAVFGGFITEQLKGGAINFVGYGSGPHSTVGSGPGGPEKYYGNGTVAVWSFVTGSLQYYNSANKNTYYILSSPDSIALGGGNNFAFYMDGDLNKGSSGACDTFASPCLSTEEEFVCSDCELYGFENSIIS